MAGENDMKCADSLTITTEVHEVKNGGFFGVPINDEKGKRREFSDYQAAYRWIDKQPNRKDLVAVDIYRKRDE